MASCEATKCRHRVSARAVLGIGPAVSGIGPADTMVVVVVVVMKTQHTTNFKLAIIVLFY